VISNGHRLDWQLQRTLEGGAHDEDIAGGRACDRIAGPGRSLRAILSEPPTAHHRAFRTWRTARYPGATDGKRALEAAWATGHRGQPARGELHHRLRVDGETHPRWS